MVEFRANPAPLHLQKHIRTLRNTKACSETSINQQRSYILCIETSSHAL